MLIILYGNISDFLSLELVESGLCYFDSNDQVQLAYPPSIVKETLYKDINNVVNLFADYVKGPALEFKQWHPKVSLQQLWTMKQ